MDYGIEALKNGMQYNIRQNAKRAVYLFGTAWLEKFDEMNAIQTCYGADPTILWNEVRCEEKRLFNCVKREIDRWDPYGFFLDAPSADKLAEVIAEKFSDSFGGNAGFTADSCKAVADEIRHRIVLFRRGENNPQKPHSSVLSGLRMGLFAYDLLYTDSFVVRDRFRFVASVSVGALGVDGYAKCCEIARGGGFCYNHIKYGGRRNAR